MHGEELKYVTEAYETNWMSTVRENVFETKMQENDCKEWIKIAA